MNDFRENHWSQFPQEDLAAAVDEASFSG